jgi:hypothetical protein
LPTRRVQHHGTFSRAQRRDVGLQPLRRQLEEPKSCLRRRATQRHRGDLDGLAGNGGALVGSSCGVAKHHGDALERQVQLFGNDLRECGSHARTEVDMAIERVDAAVGAEKEKELGVAARDRPHDAQASGAIGLAVARGRRVFEIGHGDRGDGAMASRARRTASSISICVPQRQRWYFNAPLISASLGCALRSNSAFVAMIMPFKQYPHCAA